MQSIIPQFKKWGVAGEIEKRGEFGMVFFDIFRTSIYFQEQNNSYIKSSYTLYNDGAENMNWLKKLLNNYKKNNNRHQFENAIQPACQYEMVEL